MWFSHHCVECILHYLSQGLLELTIAEQRLTYIVEQIPIAYNRLTYVSRPSHDLLIRETNGLIQNHLRTKPDLNTES